MTYEQDMAVREKYWYKDGVAAGMAAQKAEDEKIIQEIVQEKELELQQNATVLQEKDAEIARLKALLEKK